MSDVRAWLASLSPQKRDYALKHTPSHLAKAGKVQQLFRCLTNFDFIEAKVSALGVQPLIEDYDLAFNPDVLFSGEKADTLRWIQGALRLSAHVLDKDKTQLAGQLLARLMPFEVPDIQAMLQQAKHWKGAPWLRPLTPTLTPPRGTLLRTLTGHNDAVNAVVITPNGKQAISASEDNTLKVWDLQSGGTLKTLTDHTSAVKAVAITRDGQQIVSASWDKTLKVWDLQSESSVPMKTFTGHSNSVEAVAITPDGQQVVSASWDKTLKVWDLHSGEVLRTLCQSLEFAVGRRTENSLWT
jgi:WD40 repeat protein